MKTSRLLIGLVLIACLLSGWGSANAAGIDFDKASTDAKTVIPVSSPGTQLTLPPEAAQRINKRYVENLEWQLEFSQRSWSWHFYSTIFLFFIVLLIVAFGLRITYLQFQKDYEPKHGAEGSGPPTDQRKPADGTQEPPPSAGGANTTMKLSSAGLELSSQIIGLFVLGFSLAFFYLYVKEVYPVQVVNLNQSSTQTVPPKAGSNETSPTKAAPDKP